MENIQAIFALRRRRAHLAGEISEAERRLVVTRAALTNIDATLLLFDTSSDPTLIPSIRAVRRGTFFRHGQQIRLCLSALRDATDALSVREVTEYVATAKGVDSADAPLRLTLERQVRDALARLVRRRRAFRFEGKPVRFGVAPVREQ
jgi:predicted nuclease with RNAse H fold